MAEAKSITAHEMANRRVWITGASSGIGESLALELSRAGARLAISGRNEERLAEVAKQCDGDVLILPFDVTEQEAHVKAVERIEAELGGLDTVVLNAGMCEYVDLPEFDSGIFKRTMDINFMGVVYGVEASLPLLRKSPSPHLVGMSSSVSYIGLPRAEAYGASKAAIRHLFQALQTDLAAEQIDVSIICPGFVKTPLTDRNTFEMPMRITAEQSAQIIRKGLEKRKPEIRYPWLFTLILRWVAAWPAGLRIRALRSMSPNAAGTA